MPMVNTPDQLTYQFFPTSGQVFSFRVRCPHDAHLALTSQPMEGEPMYEIFIGGWQNSKSVIRRNRQKPDVAEVATPGIVDGNNYLGFWIRWYDNEICVGREGEQTAFMSYRDPQLFPIRFVGICTGWGASGSWTFEDPPTAAYPGNPSMAYAVAPPMDMGFNQGMAGGGATWIPSANGEVPPNAVQGGFDAGHTLFVARAHHNGELIPGKLHSGHRICYVPYGGEEVPHQQYEVLCNSYGTWQPVSGNNIPPNALNAGHTANGEPLFVGRGNHEGSVTIGKVQPSHGCCYIPYGGKEVALLNYEVFTTQ